MVPIRALLISRLVRSAWSVGAVALLIATVLEWGLISTVPAELP